MTITIKTNELTFSICETFYDEVVSIASELASVRTAGVLTESEFERAVLSADAAVRASQTRLLAEYGMGSASNEQTLGEALEYVFVGSQRKYYGRESVIARCIADALKELVLAEIFKPFNAELASIHAKYGVEALTELTSILTIKRPPM